MNHMRMAKHRKYHKAEDAVKMTLAMNYDTGYQKRR